MQSIQEYNQLNSAAAQAGNILGCELPAMQAATLYHAGQLVTRHDLADILGRLAGQSGWYLTRDTVALGIPSRCEDLIEGEWTNGLLTIRLKLLSDDSYQLSRFSHEPFDGGQPQHDTAYREQGIFLRPSLIASGTDLSLYRLWWRLGTPADGANEGRWLPVAQQFVGFGRSKER